MSAIDQVNYRRICSLVVDMVKAEAKASAECYNFDPLEVFRDIQLLLSGLSEMRMIDGFKLTLEEPKLIATITPVNGMAFSMDITIAKALSQHPEMPSALALTLGY